MIDLEALLREAAIILGSTCTSRGEPMYVGLTDRLEAAAAELEAQEPVAWEYYYKVNGCPAKNAHSQDCICWYREGSGPLKDRHHDEQDTPFTWREIHPTQQPAVPEGYVLVEKSIVPEDVLAAGSAAIASAMQAGITSPRTLALAAYTDMLLAESPEVRDGN